MGPHPLRTPLTVSLYYGLGRSWTQRPSVGVCSVLSPTQHPDIIIRSTTSALFFHSSSPHFLPLGRRRGSKDGDGNGEGQGKERRPRTLQETPPPPTTTTTSPHQPSQPSPSKLVIDNSGIVQLPRTPSPIR